MTLEAELRQRRAAQAPRGAGRKKRQAPPVVVVRRRLEPSSEMRLKLCLLVPALVPAWAYLVAEAFKQVRVGPGAVPLQDFVDAAAALFAAPFSIGAAVIVARTRHPGVLVAATACVGVTLMGVGMHAAANSARGLLRPAFERIGAVGSNDVVRVCCPGPVSLSVVSCISP